MKEEVRQIIQAFSKSKAGYIKVSVGGECIELSKPVNLPSPKAQKVSQNTALLHQDVIYDVHSKNVGRYHAPKVPLEEGQKISLKDSLGYIESMGLKHDIPFSKEGILLKIYVEDGNVVEFGQILFEIQEEQ